MNHLNLRRRSRAGDLRPVLRIAAVLLVCAGGLSAAMVADPEADGGAEADADGLRQSLEQFLDLLDQHRLLPEDTTDNRRAAFEAIVESLRIPASVERGPHSSSDGAQAGAEGAATVLRSVDTVGGVFVRVWIGAVDEPLLEALNAGVGGDIAHGHYEGIAVDLRAAGGDTVAAAPQAADFFKELGLPLVVLIDGNTRGAAERLAAELKDRTGAITLGKATRGVPFETFTTELPSGETVRLPRIADATGDAHRWRRQPVRPDVETDPSLPPDPAAQDPAAQPLWSPGPVDGDACLRRAVDLLTTIRAMGG